MARDGPYEPGVIGFDLERVAFGERDDWGVRSESHVPAFERSLRRKSSMQSSAHAPLGEMVSSQLSARR